MLIPQIPSLLLLREKKFTTRRPSTSTRHCSVKLSPIAENSPLLPPVGVRGRVSVPSVADHPLGPATDHRLGKLLPHQLANRTRAPPRADSSFCSSAYGGISSRFQLLFPSQGQGSYALLTRPPLETPLPVRLACVKHAASVHP
ncbi:hypothetical protein OIU76_030643 [Salix suchowensis]|nr:hypothetical protein OIU76_030643 [Salix suchowensis]